MYAKGKRLITVVGVALALAVTPAVAEKRVALVVGNAAYKNVTPLDNPPNDARLIADTLRSLGFTLVGGGAQLDLDKAGFDRAVQSLGNQLQGADVGLFYYAGHGVQVRGSNYLVPIDASPSKESDVDFQMLDADLVLRQMEDAGTKLNIVVLDACRNNPFGPHGLRAADGGLAQMRAPEGTLISFATQPGAVAQDGTSGDSPFSKALAETMKRPGLDIFRVFNEVGLAVASGTGGAQQPWLSLSPIRGDFYFVGPPAPPSGPTAARPAEDPVARVWAVTQNTTSQAVLEDFIRQFGATPYGDMARARLNELKSQLAVVTPQAVPSGSPQVSRPTIDPAVVGTFERDSVVDGYDWRFIYSIAADGSYRLDMTQQEDGTFTAGNGAYRTVAPKTGRVRTGTYRAAGSSAIQVRSAGGAAIFRPVERTTVDQTYPVMLGVWRAIAVIDGTVWTLTIQNNPDGTYHYQAEAEDNGVSAAANQRWRKTSAISGKTNTGTYRIVDASNIEITDANGPTIWHRR